MEELRYLIPLGAAILGWFLNELSQRFRSRGADRRAVARALADLLEIQHQTIALKTFLDEMSRRLNLPQHLQLVLMTYFHNLWPNTDKLHERYNQSVDAVASFDPLLGFRLRSKDQLSPFLQTLRTLVGTDVNATRLWPQLESQLMELVQSPLNETIIELARRHSWITWFRVRRRSKRPIWSAVELDGFVSKLQPLIDSAKGSAIAGS
jgi:hypothetical protein